MSQPLRRAVPTRKRTPPEAPYPGFLEYYQRRLQINRLDAASLDDCIEEAHQADLDQDSSPFDPVHYHLLLRRLLASRPKAPKLYVDIPRPDDQRSWREPVQ